MRIGTAHHELARNLGDFFLTPGCSLVPRTFYLQRFSSTTLPAGAHLWYKARDGLWWLGKVAHCPRPTILPPTPVSSASSMTPDRLRSTSCHHFTPLHGALSTGPGTFSVIRPRDWLAVSYAMLTGPAELPLSPLSMSVHYRQPQLSLLCFFFCFFVFLMSFATFRVYYNFVVSVVEPSGLL